ncbi:lycopene cyclase domain-containing protein [Paenarthrobacter sp. Z7-10]|uniref:lycopene cyclase domain-containing protein n=1 Tax=Paenarthrobacter sp. Z7-10 TaxID=2787635 RepID=UPI0022A936CE|nr:lycopene cyclase domain-containing protein [Paenarthrobacter sp. Z7-10]MCZ2402234.1 lycopene cyclase domain-containing protein [Paenarthrobacter sp. Z7-10]
MTYWALNAVFLIPAAVVCLLAFWLRRRAKSAAAAALTAIGQSAAVLLALTCIFDNVMIAAGLFSYGAGRISGARIGQAPLEDLAYPLAAVVLLPGLWLLLSPRPLRPRTNSVLPAPEGSADE